MNLNTPDGQRATKTARALVTAYLEGSAGPLYAMSLEQLEMSEEQATLITALVELASVLVRVMTPEGHSPFEVMARFVTTLEQDTGR